MRPHRLFREAAEIHKDAETGGKLAESAQRTPAGSHGKLLPSGRWENGLLPKAGLGFAVPHGSHPSRHARNGIGAPDGKQAPVHTRIQKDSGISRRLGDRRQFAGQIQTNRQWRFPSGWAGQSAGQSPPTARESKRRHRKAFPIPATRAHRIMNSKPEFYRGNEKKHRPS